MRRGRAGGRYRRCLGASTVSGGEAGERQEKFRACRERWAGVRYLSPCMGMNQ